MTDTNAFIVDQEEFDKAGLADPGAYLWTVDRVRAAEQQYGDDGPKVPVIQMKLTATHTVTTDAEGIVQEVVELENPISRNFENFKLTGKPARKLRTLYQAVTGRPLTGVDEDGKVNLLAAAEELVGGQAWNSIFHASFKRDDDSIGWKDMLTNTFKSQTPKKIYIPKEETEEA